ncbi:hypothetical protein DE146DRAFT_752935 [Phaeosphaeria sp. MPI-PUGE-AT-0046c]|nr:hypothetical protein DE146DRAFT_752935 [Phaeosphaeria sp. MPI-PUGE-AT-0046c]
MSAAPNGYARDQPTGFSNRIKRVAVVGAGGKMGSHIVEQLLAGRKHVVTAITRPDSASKMPEGVRVARVNYCSKNDNDVAALVEILRGQQVLLVTMSHQSMATTKSLVHAAAAAGVPYILPNWYGHDANNKQLVEDSLMDSLLDNAKEVKKLGVSSYFLLVCNFWYEFSLGGGRDRYGFDFSNRSLVLYDNGEVAINTSTWPQCGRAITQLLSLKELPENENDTSATLSQFRNECVYISSFRLNQREMFDSVKRVTSTTDADWKISNTNTEESYKEGMQVLKSGDPEGWMKMAYSRMFFPRGGGDYEASRGLHNELFGLPSEELDHYTAIAVRRGENGEV